MKPNLRIFTRSLTVIAVLGLLVATPGVKAETPREEMTSAAALGAGTTRLGYDLYAGGLKALRAELAVDLGDGGYRVQLNAFIQGFLATFFSLDFKVVSEGELDSGAPSPRGYDMHSIWQKDKERRISMVFPSDGAPVIDFVPEDRRPTKDAVPEDMRIGTVDPISALLWPISTLLEKGRCEGSSQIFDGRKLFAVRLEDAGTLTLRATGYSPFSGETRICRVHIEQTEGPKKERTRERVPGEIKVYFAPLTPGGAPLPLRLEARNRLGKIVMHLTDAEGALTVEQLTQR